jgi:hypothetical protein
MKRVLGLLAVLALLVGCDGKDQDRLGRVGKKVAEKGRHAADDAKLPKVSVTYPPADAAKKP